MSKQHCLTTGCMRVQKIRGLCGAHYAAASKYITQGKTSWAKLEAAGKVLPAEKGGRPTNKPHRNYGEVRDYFIGDGKSEEYKNLCVPVLD